MAGESTLSDVQAGRIRRAERTVASTSTLEGIAGAAGVILPILGLVGVAPVWMVGISLIVVGGGLLLEGGALIAGYGALTGSESGTIGRPATGSASAQLLGGAAAVTLGIIALAANASISLFAVAVLALGGATLLGAGATARMSGLSLSTRDERFQRAVSESIRASAAAEVLTGAGAVVLAIIVLAGVAPATQVTLLLVAILAVGASVFLAGSSLGARMERALKA